MKNVKRLLVATLALVSAGSMAIGPVTPVSESAPVRISAALNGQLNGVKPATGTEGSMGLGQWGGGLGFAHNVGYDFEYGLSLATGWKNEMGMFKTGNDNAGFMHLDTEILLRYMPEIAESFRLGGVTQIGYSRKFGEAGKFYNDAMSFGDMSLKVGPAMNYAFSDAFSLYTAVTYNLTNIRFGVKDGAVGAVTKDNSNLHGIAMPLGLNLAIAENAAIFFEADSRISNFSFKPGVMKSFEEEVSLGVTFAI